MDADEGGGREKKAVITSVLSCLFLRDTVGNLDVEVFSANPGTFVTPGTKFLTRCRKKRLEACEIANTSFDGF